MLPALDSRFTFQCYAKARPLSQAPKKIMRLPGVSPSGAWVRSCNVDARDGRGYVEITTQRALAMTFDGVGAALDYYRRQSTVQPLRDDEKPNRPLTAYTIEIENL